MVMEARQGASSSSAAASLMLTSGASGRVNALFSARAMKSFVANLCAFLLMLLMPFRFRKRSAVSSAVMAGEKGREERSSEDHQKGMRVPASALPLRVAVSAVLDQEVAARRALAKKRVVKDDDEATTRKFALFTTTRGDTLFTQTWTPVGRKISGRYSNFAKKLNANGFKVYGMDWIGHGGSDGLHAYVCSLDYAVHDLKSYLEKMKAQNPRLPCFCFGHSTGGAIILKAMLDPKVETGISGVVLTSPAVGVQRAHPIYMIMAPIMAFLLPRYQVGTANKPGMPVSRDPDALLAKYSDPLVYTGHIRVRTGYEILRIAAHIQQNAKGLRVPFLVLHGTADSVTDPDGSTKLYEEASSTDKTIRLLEGHVHDLLFEPKLDREAVMRDIVEWLTQRAAH